MTAMLLVDIQVNIWEVSAGVTKHRTVLLILLQFFSKYPAMGITLYRWSVMA